MTNLYLAYECIPFDEMPFCSALKGHVPSFSDLFDCLDASGREHEILAWIVKNNTEQLGILFTPLEKGEDDKCRFGDFDDVDALVKTYNEKLYNSTKQQLRKLIIKNNHIFIESYKEDTVSIIQTIKTLTVSGVGNYSIAVNHWLQNTDYQIDSDEKKTALINMFAESRVSLIYGSAGTSKSTLINHISHFFHDYSRLYLAHTNPAVNNLKRKVAVSSNCAFGLKTRLRYSYY